jgi:hypothetical protein
MLVMTWISWMSTILGRQLLNIADSSVHRQLLRMLQPGGAGQHSEDAAQGVVLQQAGGVLPAIQGRPGPAGGAQHLQTVHQWLVLQEAEAQPPAVQQPVQMVASQQKSLRPPQMTFGSSSRKCKLRLPACES